MLLSCIGQRSLSNSGVLEGLLNLLDGLLCPLQQSQAAAQRRTEGKVRIQMCSLSTTSNSWCFWSRNYKQKMSLSVFSRCFGYSHDQLGSDVGVQTPGLCGQYRRWGRRREEASWRERAREKFYGYMNCTVELFFTVCPKPTVYPFYSTIRLSRFIWTWLCNLQMVSLYILSCWIVIILQNDYTHSELF